MLYPYHAMPLLGHITFCNCKKVKMYRSFKYSRFSMFIIVTSKTIMKNGIDLQCKNGYWDLQSFETPVLKIQNNSRKSKKA
jgi:hypothetical protein